MMQTRINSLKASVERYLLWKLNKNTKIIIIDKKNNNLEGILYYYITKRKSCIYTHGVQWAKIVVCSKQRK